MVSQCIIWAIMMVESAGNPRAVSHANARGLMQLTPIGVLEVQQQYGITEQPDLFDPITSIKWGTLLFQHYQDVAGGKLEGALALYNGGYRAYNQYIQGRRMNPETTQYLPRVIRAWNNCELREGIDKPWDVEVDYTLQPWDVETSRKVEVQKMLQHTYRR